MSDRTVTVRFFEVRNLTGDKTKFSECCKLAFQKPLANREVEVEPELAFRLERFTPAAGSAPMRGQFVRMQTQNLPHKAESGKELAELDVESLGHSTAFQYIPSRRLLALQMSHNGITPIRISVYLEKLLSVKGWSILPILTTNSARQLREGNVRQLHVRVGSPQDLNATTPDEIAVMDALKGMKNVGNMTYVAVTLGMGRAKTHMNSNFASRIARWLVSETKSNKAAKVRQVSATVRNAETGHLELLRLLKAHLGNQGIIKIPKKPIDAYASIDAFITQAWKANEAELEKQYP